MFCFLIIIVLSSFLSAQVNSGARNLSLCNSDVALCNDIFSLYRNPAGTAGLNSISLGADYLPTPFGLSELSQTTAAISVPFSFGTFSGGVMSYGYNLYRETKFLFSYSALLNSSILFGSSLNYQRIAIRNYGTDGSFYLTLGAIAKLSHIIRLGFSAENITNATIGKDDGQIPVVLHSGLSFILSDEFNAHLAVHKDLIYKFCISTSVEYTFMEILSLRSGFSSDPVLYAGGIGINFLYFNFDYGFSLHQQLGITHQVSLVYSFSANELPHTAVRSHPENEK